MLFQGCCCVKNSTTVKNEIVMMEGDEIIATNIRYGTISIKAGKGFVRYYTWDGQTRSVEMIPRKERWYGSLGIYFPGAGNHWKENNKITRGVLDEGQLNFNSIDDALRFLHHPSRLDGSTVYNDNGLVVSWSKAINPNDGGRGSTLSVDVWQVLIQGQRPTMLPGSKNDSITIKHLNP